MTTPLASSYYDPLHSSDFEFRGVLITELQEVRDYILEKIKAFSITFFQEIETLQRAEDGSFYLHRVIPILPFQTVDSSLATLFKKKKFEGVESDLAKSVENSWEEIQKKMMDSILAQTADLVEKVVENYLNTRESDKRFIVTIGKHEIFFFDKIGNEGRPRSKIVYFNSTPEEVFIAADSLRQFHFSPDNNRSIGYFGVDVIVEKAAAHGCCHIL